MANSSIDIQLDTIVKISEGQVSAELGEEEVILNINNGIYYGLNEVGRDIWQYIQKPQSVENIVKNIQDLYEVEMEQCQKDVFILLKDLLKEGLIEVVNGTSA